MSGNTADMPALSAMGHASADILEPAQTHDACELALNPALHWNMIELQHIWQTFSSPDGKSTVHAVKDVSLTIHDGEIFGVLGHSGAGKSTLVRCINLLNRPTKGKVIVDGQDLTAMPPAQLREVRHKIGMIFQHFNLLSSRTVFGNIALPLELSGRSKEEIHKKVLPLIELVGLSEHTDKYPAQLSGGQKQRVGIARALANDPTVLLSDEATSALDPETTASTLDLLKKINRELGVTIVMITHQMEVVKQICGKIAVMERGEVIEQGDVQDVFRSPKHPATRSMLQGVLATDLPPLVLRMIRQHFDEHPAACNKVLRITFVGNESTRPVIAHCAKEFNVDFNILRGQIFDIQDKPFGSLTVVTSCRQEDYEKVKKYMAEKGIQLEEVDYANHA